MKKQEMIMQTKLTLIKNTKKLFLTSAIALAGLTSSTGVNATADFHWDMEIETTAKDYPDLGLGNPATLDLINGVELVLQNGAYLTSGENFPSGNALKLDAVDDVALFWQSGNIIEDTLDPSKMRIELYAKADESFTDAYVFDRWGQVVLGVWQDGFRIIAFHADGGAASETFTTPDFDATKWNNFAVEIDGESLTVFINDVFVGIIALKGGLNPTTSKVVGFIGERYNGKNKFKGYIDEVKIISDFDAYNPHPSLLLGQDKHVGPGNDSTLTVQLSDTAITYPVTVPYQISGDAVLDTTGEIVFSEGTEQSVTIPVLAGAVAEQTATLTLTSAVNAQITADDAVTLTVVTHNVAPQLAVTLTQNNQAISVIDASAGDVSVTANVTDLNLADLHDVSWTVNNTAFVGIADDTLLTYTFNPADLSAGTYGLNVTASENNSADSYPVTLAIDLPVFSALPALAVDVDTDGDGIFDSIEGYTDQDNDRILDYLDNDSNTSRVALGASEQPLQTLTGLKLAVGRFAVAAGGLLTDSATLSAESLTEHALDASGAPLGNTDDSYYIAAQGATLINFSVSGLETGTSAAIVYPLLANTTIPEDAIYRKYTPANGWVTFVSDSDNRLSSASKDNVGNCPAPLSDSYTLGLTTGASCIQLEIVDGGIYDADGLSNGVVEDPGYLAIQNENMPPEIDMVLSHQVSEGKEVTLDASNTTDLNGDTLSFSWSQTSGTPATFTPANADTLTFVSPQVAEDETLIFELQVSDGEFTTTAEIELKVLNNSAPTIAINYSQLSFAEKTEASVLAQGSDGDELTYKWQQIAVDGQPTVTIANDAVDTLVFTAPDVDANQELSFRVTVSDHEFDISQDIVVTIANVEPLKLPMKSTGGSAYWLLLIVSTVLVARKRLFTK
jgi:hypothetical protein